MKINEVITEALNTDTGTTNPDRPSSASFKSNRQAQPTQAPVGSQVKTSRGIAVKAENGDWEIEENDQVTVVRNPETIQGLEQAAQQQPQQAAASAPTPTAQPAEKPAEQPVAPAPASPSRSDALTQKYVKLWQDWIKSNPKENTPDGLQNYVARFITKGQTVGPTPGKESLTPDGIQKYFKNMFDSMEQVIQAKKNNTNKGLTTLPSGVQVLHIGGKLPSGRPAPTVVRYKNQDYAKNEKGTWFHVQSGKPLADRNPQLSQFLDMELSRL